MKKVTDTSILGQLNATKVTDPNILAQLEGTPERSFIEKAGRYAGDVALGTLETAATVATGVPAAAMGLVGSIGKKLGGATDIEAKEHREAITKAYTYQPQTESGKGTVGIIGKATYPIAKGLELVGEYGGESARNVIEATMFMVAPRVPQSVKSAIASAKKARNIRFEIKKVDALNTQLDKMIDTKLNKAIRPSVSGKKTLTKMKRFDENANAAIKDMTRNKKLNSFERNGKIVEGQNPKTLGEMAKTLDDNLSRAAQRRTELAAQAGEKSIYINGVRTASVLDEVVNNPRKYPKSRADAIEIQDWVSGKTIARDPKTLQATTVYRNQKMTPVQAQELIRELNVEAKKWYKNPDAHSKAYLAEKAAQQLRQDMVDGLGKGGAEYKALGQEMRNYMSIEKDLMNRWQVDKRKNTYGFFDLGNLMTAVELAKAVVSKSPAHAVVAGTVFATKKYMNYLNKSNTQVSKLFKDTERIMGVIDRKSPPALGDPWADIGVTKGMKTAPKQAAQIEWKPEFTATGEQISVPYYGKGYKAAPKEMTAGEITTAQRRMVSPSQMDAINKSIERNPMSGEAFEIQGKAGIKPPHVGNMVDDAKNALVKIVAENNKIGRRMTESQIEQVWQEGLSRLEQIRQSQQSAVPLGRELAAESGRATPGFKRTAKQKIDIAGGNK